MVETLWCVKVTKKMEMKIVHPTVHQSQRDRKSMYLTPAAFGDRLSLCLGQCILCNTLALSGFVISPPGSVRRILIQELL